MSEYRGRDRSTARSRVAELVRTSRADVVGLTEVFEMTTGLESPLLDRQVIKSAVADVYPFTAELGSAWTVPARLSAKARSKFEYDGPLWYGVEGGLPADTPVAIPRPSELLLLSRHPMTTEGQAYRRAFGADELAVKGVIHSRVTTRGGTELDVFLTHLQNNNETDLDGTKTKAMAALRGQMRQLARFIRQQRQQQVIGWTGDRPPPPPHWFEVRPALVMGDFNSPAPLGPVANSALTAALGLSDLWVNTGVAPPGTREGITSDDVKAFGPQTAPLALDHPLRHFSGTRIDYLLAGRGSYPWDDLRPARVVVPRWGPTRLRTWELRGGSGIDLSDHYGLITNLRETTIYLVESALTPPPPGGVATPA
jgi:endonuclease/exonuclease/phosphatase family metal-dependent hydrolase